MAKQEILSVSYDASLLLTREHILEQAGYAVTSSLGMATALEHCAARRFDLIVIGHSIPVRDKDMLIAAAKARCPVPVLSLRRHLDLPNPHADFSVDAAEGPEVFLQAVRRALRGSGKQVSSEPPITAELQNRPQGKEESNV